MTREREITVLYVDDEEVNLFLFEANFKKKFKVITSSSPVTALDQLDIHHDDIIVVISDMKMPVMSGLEFIEKAKVKYKNIFYYILTGFDYSTEIEEAISNKTIKKSFTKPFNKQEIEEEIYLAADSLMN